MGGRIGAYRFIDDSEVGRKLQVFSPSDGVSGFVQEKVD